MQLLCHTCNYLDTLKKHFSLLAYCQSHASPEMKQDGSVSLVQKHACSSFRTREQLPRENVKHSWNNIYSEICYLNPKCLLKTTTPRLLLKGPPRSKEYRSVFLCKFSNLLKSKTETNIGMLMQLLVWQLIFGTILLLLFHYPN